MLAGSGSAGAPANVVRAVTWWPSGRKPPDCRAPIPGSRHPVRFGLTVESHAPMVVDGAVGGSGSPSTVIGSGLGAGGFSRTSGSSFRQLRSEFEQPAPRKSVAPSSAATGGYQTFTLTRP